ncbi:MAG TPA: hypothetical protein VK280_29930 [Streptosporangiaceae bacterium]|nr:hypothetical protein [Streptosporangiaceae bacterium]
MTIDTAPNGSICDGGTAARRGSFDAGWCAAAGSWASPWSRSCRATCILTAAASPGGCRPARRLARPARSTRQLARAGLPPVDKAARLLLGGAAVVVGSPATDPVPDPALPHVGVLAWGDPAAELPGAEVQSSIMALA